LSLPLWLVDASYRYGFLVLSALSPWVVLKDPPLCLKELSEVEGFGSLKLLWANKTEVEKRTTKARVIVRNFLMIPPFLNRNCWLPNKLE